MIAIIDSGGANITSVMSAFERLGVAAKLTKLPAEIKAAERVILPGVGAATAAMEKLEKSGLVEVIRGLTQPVMGICLGMQLLYDRSEEGDCRTLGLVQGDITKFAPVADCPVPHMGWNNVSIKADHPLLAGINADSYFYFVHSYYAPVSADTLAATDYSAPFTAITAYKNFMGCQFHPERSGAAGRRILENFIALKL